MSLEFCPNCGAEVPTKARACPACGSCPETGWSDESRADGLDLPDDSFDYDDYAQREFGGKRLLPRGIRPFWWFVALALLGLAAWAFLQKIF